MGDVIYISERLADESRPSRHPAAFFFALSSPLSYLAVERVERALGPVVWVPVLVKPDAQTFALAEQWAQIQGLPLVEPQSFQQEGLEVSRAAVYAGERGRGLRFALAASRLIFCGGFSADDKRVIRAAAEVAGLDVDEAVIASADADYDLRLRATTAGMHRQGVFAAPAVRVGSHWFSGPEAVGEAAAYSARAAAYGQPGTTA